MSYDNDNQANLAETLSEILPDAQVLLTHPTTDVPGLHIAHVAVPKNFDLKEVKVDLEAHLPNPRKTVATAALDDLTSFLGYVVRHAQENSVVWCNFDPQTFNLKFTAVIDEHADKLAGWRKHTAVFAPAMSAEWKVWAALNKRSQPQLEFAEFLERNEGDIALKEGFPTSAEMMNMATNFEASSEKHLRSSVKLQGGGVKLVYIDGEDEKTLQEMKLFERFTIGIPVFWADHGYFIEARLKHRTASGKVSFHYELIRPDRVHEAAAKELIEVVRKGIGATPLLMGDCK
jgi:uncharacterized protein YfdQ (DUF2303 family)